MNNDASDILKNLFIFRSGENKGFLEVIKQQKENKNTAERMKEYEDNWIRYMKTIVDGNIVDAVNEIYALCNNRTVDADVKAKVFDLFNLVNNVDGGA